VDVFGGRLGRGQRRPVISLRQLGQQGQLARRARIEIAERRLGAFGDVTQGDLAPRPLGGERKERRAGALQDSFIRVAAPIRADRARRRALSGASPASAAAASRASTMA
jgi:hypothetical protein